MQLELDVEGSFGFADDVFIDNSLMQEHEIEHGSFVNGTAIINYNKKKGSWGWKAIKIM